MFHTKQDQTTNLQLDEVLTYDTRSNFEQQNMVKKHIVRMYRAYEQLNSKQTNIPLTVSIERLQYVIGEELLGIFRQQLNINRRS
jgi:hypothetical protein